MRLMSLFCSAVIGDTNLVGQIEAVSQRQREDREYRAALAKLHSIFPIIDMINCRSMTIKASYYDKQPVIGLAYPTSNERALISISNIAGTLCKLANSLSLPTIIQR